MKKPKPAPNLNKRTIGEMASVANELQALLGMVYEHSDATPDQTLCIGLAWNLACKVSTWLDVESGGEI